MSKEIIIGVAFVFALLMWTIFVFGLATIYDAFLMWRERRQKTIIFQPGDKRGARKNIITDPLLLQAGIDRIKKDGRGWLKLSGKFSEVVFADALYDFSDMTIILPRTKISRVVTLDGCSIRGLSKIKVDDAWKWTNKSTTGPVITVDEHSEQFIFIFLREGLLFKRDCGLEFIQESVSHPMFEVRGSLVMQYKRSNTLDVANSFTN